MDLAAAEGRTFGRGWIIAVLGIAVTLLASLGTHDATHDRLATTGCDRLRHDPRAERAVEAIASRHAEQLKACYFESLAGGGVAESFIVASYGIRSDGRLAVFSLDKRAHESLGRCLIAQIETWQLDTKYGRTAGRFQIHFE